MVSRDRHPYHMGTYHMANKNSFEPQRNNNFEVQIVFDAADGIDSKIITLSVDTFSAPNININVIPVPYGNNKIKFAGTPDFEDSSIQLNDFIGLEVEKKLSDWQKMVYNYSNQKIGLATDYKKTGYLIEYDPAGGNPRAWQLVGCWPSRLQLGEFAQEGNQVRKVSLTLTYDYAIPETYGSTMEP